MPLNLDEAPNPQDASCTTWFHVHSIGLVAAEHEDVVPLASRKKPYVAWRVDYAGTGLVAARALQDYHVERGRSLIEGNGTTNAEPGTSKQTLRPRQT